VPDCRIRIVGSSFSESYMKDWSDDEKFGFSLRTGWETPFSEQRVVDEEGNVLIVDSTKAARSMQKATSPKIIAKG